MQPDAPFILFPFVGYTCQMATGQQFLGKWRGGGERMRRPGCAQERSFSNSVWCKNPIKERRLAGRQTPSMSLERTRLAALAKQMSRANPT